MCRAFGILPAGRSSPRLALSVMLLFDHRFDGSTSAAERASPASACWTTATADDEAKAICRSCPRRWLCAREAYESPRAEGLWAGIYVPEAGRCHTFALRQSILLPSTTAIPSASAACITPREPDRLVAAWRGVCGGRAGPDLN